MTERSVDRESFVLERARKGLAPGAAQRRATLGRLGAALAFGSVVPPAPSAPGPASPAPVSGFAKGAASFSLRALVTGVVSAAVVGFGAGYLVPRRPVAPAVEARPIAPASTVAPQVRPQASPVTPPGTAPAFAAASAREAPGQALAVTSGGSQRHSTRRDPERREPVPSANYDELSYVQRAQTALRNGDAALALGLMQSLDQLQPKGALLAERAVVSVLALCRLDRANDARLLASATWKSGNAPEVYRRRMENSCVGPVGEAGEE
ncbi:MAG TPA: hypothetical protein VGK73_12265 [Polyangiaceae bacterium]